MTTHLRARWIRVAAVTALAGAALAVPAAPAAAAAPAIQIVSVSSESVKPGESVRVRFRATNNERGRATVFVAVSGGLRCTAGCSTSKVLGAGQSATFDATVVAPEVSPGETSGRNLAVSVRVGTQTAFDHRMILVGGAGATAPTVKQIAGRIRGAGGKAIGGVKVAVRDSAGHEFRATSDRRGRFTIKASAGQPIAAGAITVVAAKAGYRTASASVRGTAGKTATVRLTLATVATPSTPPPSPSAEASLPAAAPEETQSPAAVPAPTVEAAGDDEGSSPLIILLGGLLVAVGLGALVLVLIRRRNTSRIGAGVAEPTAVLPTVFPADGYQRKG
ncbi:carboxypeptidase-like regulatory domain-containing protein [Actinoplanes sp. NPDC024001]|uniref:carboxypeptidase-like regulatory domain-containing protein n=1 Tax=Actinoplanes sp. NPDC024001 TaxID=3154598 RepID=UPI0033E09CA0